ncbi:MAG: preprotein translocase subunit SecY [Phycisphaeraceae bacterium]|nr:preprotein translocase subunit SecY [Phycisphaeraceae bacterium]
MFRAFLNIWRIPELRNKVLFTLGMLAIYRMGFKIPLPAVDQSALMEWAEKISGSAGGNLLSYVSIFTGGSLAHSTIFGLGIMPYISAAIIVQLLTTVLDSLKQLQKEGPAGQQKIQEYTRYLTVPLCILQAIFWMNFIVHQRLVYADYTYGVNWAIFWFTGLIGLTAGSIFLMWVGEQIDKFGIGNGVSLIITAGIVSQMPEAVRMVASDFSLSGGEGSFRIDTVLFLIAAFVFVVAGAIVITQGQRRIPIQQAKHTRGRRVYGGQRSYLPLRVNHGGVMPIIFASSLMMFPSFIISWLQSVTGGQWGWVNFLSRNFQMQGYLYIVLYILLIYFFSYFWTTVQFQPKEMATQLRDHGSFIPGLRPGPRTAEYLETVMERITYVGAGFLAVIAVIPTVVSNELKVPYFVTTFLGGTGLLIVVSVMLDLIQRIEASLMMRNYQGFLASGGSGRGPKIRGRLH